MAVSKNITKKYQSFASIARAYKGQKQTGRAFHMTFIVQHNNVLAVGINDYNREIKRTSFGEYKFYGGSEYKPSLHSEVSALLKLGEEDCSKYDFYNIRIDNNNNIASSIPCQNCKRLLDVVGYKRIIAVDENGELIIVD